MIIEGINIQKALIIDTPWIEYILNGEKIWEMRSTDAKHRGWFGLIQKGTGKIVGIAYLSDTILKISKEELIASKEKHCVDYEKNPELLKWNTAWVLSSVQRIKPVPYTHKPGAVRWVNI